MTHSALFALGFAAWIVTGIVLGLVMGRRGHNAFGWLVIGSILGPLAVIIALVLAHDEPQGASRTLVPAVRGQGPVDVLVGLDGSPEAANALHAALAILGPRVGRLSLAGVVDYDLAATDPPAEGERQLRAELARQEAYVLSLAPRFELASAASHAAHPEVVILTGRPSTALTTKATEEGFDLIVVGTRGRGLSRALLGSVASELASHSKVPVLLAGTGAAQPAG